MVIAAPFKDMTQFRPKVLVATRVLQVSYLPVTGSFDNVSLGVTATEINMTHKHANSPVQVWRCPD